MSPSSAGYALPPSLAAAAAALHHESALVVLVLAGFALLLTFLVAFLKDVHDAGGWWDWRSKGDAYKNQRSVSGVMRAQNDSQTARILHEAEIARAARTREARPRRPWRRGGTPVERRLTSWSSHAEPQPLVRPRTRASGPASQLRLYDEPAPIDVESDVGSS
ncbi:MAG: hypothetical protein PGN13_08525 [Patulibacter minatonensis]